MGDEEREQRLEKVRTRTSVVIFWKLWLFANAAAGCIQSLGWLASLEKAI